MEENFQKGVFQIKASCVADGLLSGNKGSLDEYKVKTSLGSGFLVVHDSVLCIFTCAHVILGCVGTTNKVEAIHAGIGYPCKVRAVCPERDAAVLVFSGSFPQVKPFIFGFDKHLQAGKSKLLVSGFPLGDSARKERICLFNGWTEGRLQIDGAINAGDSGAAVTNENNEIVGMVTSGVPHAHGVSWARPATVLKTLCVKEESTIIQYLPVLGIKHHPTSADFGKHYNCPSGLRVCSVEAWSCLAQKAKAGDIITHVCLDEGEEMYPISWSGMVSTPWSKFKDKDTLVHLDKLLYHKQKNIKIKLWRPLEEKSFDYILDLCVSPNECHGPFLPLEQRCVAVGGLVIMWLVVNTYNKELCDELGVKENMLCVVKINENSPFGDLEVFKRGDKITALNDKGVNSLESVKIVLREFLNGSILFLSIESCSKIAVCSRQKILEYNELSKKIGRIL